MKTYIKLISAICLALSVIVISCGQKTSDEAELYKIPPAFFDAITITAESDTLMPTNLQLTGDTLFVSYYHCAAIDMFTYSMGPLISFNKIGTINLSDPEPVYPTSFAITDSLIIVSDHAKKVVVLYNRDGSFKNSFGFLPDGKTQLSPFDLTYFGGVLYLTDIELGKVLAISMTDAENITEMGELILKIPSNPEMIIGFPSCIDVTFDGRLFVGDAQNALVKVFTCDGRFIYNFDTVSTPKPFSPKGFAMDSKIDPSMQDTSSFDPSGIRKMGRIHVVDPNNSTVHMFNPVGKYVASYKTNEKMVKPADIAVDRKNKAIFIADPQAKQIFIYSYERN